MAFGIGYSRWLGETQSPVLLWAYPRQEEPWPLNPSRDGTGELGRGAALHAAPFFLRTRRSLWAQPSAAGAMPLGITDALARCLWRGTS